jgi:TatD DNase family protein
VAIGEIGRDRARSGVDLPTQQAFFTRQLALAARWNLPASIHCVKAWGAMEELLRTHPVPARGVLLHAYNGPAEMLPSLLKSGAYFSFSGQHFARSFRRKSNGQTAWQEPFRRIPADRLLVETDAPDGLAGLPEAQASLANGEEPAAFHRRYATGLQTLYAVLAGLRGESPEGLEAQVAENFQRFFGAEG